MEYVRRAHAARSTDSYVFNQLIPYIGNKRKLLSLIGQALKAAGVGPGGHFVDLFAGSGVVSRYAKSLGYRVTANDWEPYAEAINGCYIALNEAPVYFDGRSYEDVLEELNSLEPIEGWITRHLCPDDDENYDVKRDRLFYMRKNGMRLDAIRTKIMEWDEAGELTAGQKNALLAPLLYQASYTSNTSGVFKGFHNGWGGQTGTALYRIKGDVKLQPAVFSNTDLHCHVTRVDATKLARALKETGQTPDFVYLDPPYNQHPYGSNYHVLNTVTLYDSPPLSPKISGHGDKSAIRLDWRTERRSAYNHRGQAHEAYDQLVQELDARWIATSYSTDGNIELDDMIRSCVERGDTRAFVQGYKRYRVSSQRFSNKPMNVEFVLLVNTRAQSSRSVDELHSTILETERAVLEAHPETGGVPQMDLFAANG